MSLLLDTNILITLLNSDELPLPPFRGAYCISVITEAEILCYSGMSYKEIELISELIATLNVIPVDSMIAQRAAQLGRTRSGKLPDLLIAATAIEYELTLITKNLKDFTAIPYLEIRDTIMLS